MPTRQSVKQLLLRGLEPAKGKWLLLAACHNLRKLHGHLGNAGLAALASTWPGTSPRANAHAAGKPSANRYPLPRQRTSDPTAFQRPAGAYRPALLATCCGT